MPFSDVWSDLIPDDNTDADLLGADVRQLRLDIHERMTAAFVLDWAADPLIVQPLLRGQKAGIIVTIPFADFLLAGIDASAGNISVATGGVVVAPIRVPNGCTITQMSVLCDPGFGDTLTVSIYRRLFTNSVTAGASVFDLPCNAVGLQATLSGVINHLVDSGYYYWLHASNFGGNVAALHAVQLIISRDSNDHST